MREQLTTFCHLRDKAVEVVCLHCLVESDDVGMAQSSHELSFSQKVLSNVLFFNLVCFNNLDGHL